MDEEEKPRGDRSVRRARAPRNKLDPHALVRREYERHGHLLELLQESEAKDAIEKDSADF